MTYWHPASSEEAISLQEFTDEEIADIDSVIGKDKAENFISEPDYADIAFAMFLESLPS